MGGDGLPAVVPDPARAEHRVELGTAVRRRGRVVEAAAHADPVERRLDVPLDPRGWLDVEHVEDRGHDVHGVVVLVAHLAPGRHPRRPRDDARVGGAPVELVALPHLEGRVERHRPAVGVVVVGLRATELLEHLEVVRDLVGQTVDELHLVDGAVRAALAARAVVRDHDDQGVLALAALLEVVEQAPDLVVRVREEAGVHLGHPAEQPALLGGQGVPRPGLVHGGERDAVRAAAGLRGADRVDRGQLGVGGDDAQLLLAGEGLLAHHLVARRRTCPGSGPPTPSAHGAARAPRRARSRGRRASRARSPSSP